MIFLAAVVLLGTPDPMDIHAGDFLDLNPREALNSAADAYLLEDWHTAAAEYLNVLEYRPWELHRYLQSRLLLRSYGRR